MNYQHQGQLAFTVDSATFPGGSTSRFTGLAPVGQTAAGELFLRDDPRCTTNPANLTVCDAAHMRHLVVWTCDALAEG